MSDWTDMEAEIKRLPYLYGDSDEANREKTSLAMKHMQLQLLLKISKSLEEINNYGIGP